MDEARTERVAELMAAMAGGNATAAFSLRDEFGGSISAAVRDTLGRRSAWCGAEEVEGLVVDVCLMLFDIATGWSPYGGALPWTWAARPIGTLVDLHLGQFAGPLGDWADESLARTSEGHVAGRSQEPPVLDVLAGLGARHPAARLLHEALGTVATPRDGELFLELRIQQLLGDRSPSVTVGGLLGLQPEAVRQQHRRVRMRLRSLAETDQRFAPLASLALVA